MSRTVDEQEQPAKQWQVTNLENLLRQQNDTIQRIDSKLDGQVTNTTLESRLKDEIDKIHLQYGPLADNIKWIVRAIVGGIVGIIVQGIIIAVNTWGR